MMKDMFSSDMEFYNIEKDITVFGITVNSFPEGINDHFDQLSSMLPTNDQRPYFGICRMKDEKLEYIAAALETYPWEAGKYGLNTYTVGKGEYLCYRLKAWRTQTQAIKGIFCELLKDERADHRSPSIEIYQNDHEMLCLVRIKANVMVDHT